MSRNWVGPVILITSCIFFTGSFSLAKQLSGIVPIYTILLFRFFAGPLYLTPLFVLTQKKLVIHVYSTFLWRVLFGALAMTCLFFSFKFGQIGKSIIIFECSAIWSLLYDYWKGNKCPHRYSLWAVPVAFVAMILIIQPHNTTQVQLGDLLALLASIFNVGVYITLKKLSANHDTTTIVLVSCFLAMLLFLIPNSGVFPVLSVQTVKWLLMMGTISLGAQLCLTQGFKLSSVGTGGLLMLSIVPLTTLSGVVFFSETYNTLAWSGMILMVLSLAVIARWK